MSMKSMEDSSLDMVGVTGSIPVAPTKEQPLTEPAEKTGQQVASSWISLADRMPEPEVFVLCWDGRKCFVDWWGSLRDNGNGATHWLPFPQPPGASDMYDGRRA